MSGFQGMSAENLGAKVNDMLDCSCVQDARVCLLALSGYRRMLDRQPCVFLLEVWSPHSPIRFI